MTLIVTKTEEDSQGGPSIHTWFIAAPTSFPRGLVGIELAGLVWIYRPVDTEAGCVWDKDVLFYKYKQIKSVIPSPYLSPTTTNHILRSPRGLHTNSTRFFSALFHEAHFPLACRTNVSQSPSFLLSVVPGVRACRRLQ